ncbi:MAG: type III-A CRISPR-associated RAMP protein Csm5 [Pseudomonadota bacterium]
MTRCCLEILSPVHIGCGEVYEPTGFVVDEDHRRLVIFDPAVFYSDLDEQSKAEFSEICRRGTIRSVLDIYRFLRGRQAEGRHVDVCAGFLRTYERTLNLSSAGEKALVGQLNDFAIPRTAYLVDTDRPYIPGSAVKGALRTAYLNAINREKPKKRFSGKHAANDLEKYLFEGTFQTDPFRLVKVSDFMPVGDIRTRVIYAVNKKKRPSRPERDDLSQMLEVILPPALFIGTIAIERPLKEAGICNAPTLETLWHSMNSFFKAEKSREDVDLTRIQARPVIIENGRNAALLRIGRHCGAESVTIKGHRDIGSTQKRGGKPVKKEEAGTLWLAASHPRPNEGEPLEPFGWVVLSEPEEMLRVQLEDTELEWSEEHERLFENRVEKLKRALAEAAEQKRMELEKAERRRLEHEQRQREEERRKAEEAAMTPEQRATARVKSPDVKEAEVVEIYSRLDEFQDKHGLAEALKEYWVKAGKWNNKDCSKKQWKKVEKVKGILGVE